jgi:hypothetical protein
MVRTAGFKPSTNAHFAGNPNRPTRIAHKKMAGLLWVSNQDLVVETWRKIPSLIEAAILAMLESVEAHYRSPKKLELPHLGCYDATRP